MNLSNLSHAALALSAQVVIGMLAYACGSSIVSASVIGGCFVVGFYFGREVAQAERKAGTPPWWSGFIMTRWSWDAIFDLLCPAVACSALVLVAVFLRGEL